MKRRSALIGIGFGLLSLASLVIVCTAVTLVMYLLGVGAP